MGAPYPPLNGTEMGSNLAYLFTYIDTVIPLNLFGLFMVVAFFSVVVIGSLTMQLRFTGRIRPETSFLAASFATLGFATILEQISGILSPIYFIILIIAFIASLVWVSLAGE